jgi:hypothetical protein
MNYYFLSLLEPDKKRRRNVIRIYNIGHSPRNSGDNINPKLIDKIHMKLKEFGIENEYQKHTFKQGFEAGESIGVLKKKYWEQIQDYNTPIYERVITGTNYEEEIINRFRSLQPGDRCCINYGLGYWDGKVFQHYYTNFFPHIQENIPGANIFTLDIERKIPKMKSEFHSSFYKFPRVKIGKVKYDLFFFCCRQLDINSYRFVINNLEKFHGPNISELYHIHTLLDKKVSNFIDVKKFNVEFLVQKKKVLFVEIL